MLHELIRRFHDVVKANFSLSFSSSFFCSYPILASNVANNVILLNASMLLSVRSMVYKSRFLKGLRLLDSTQNLSVPSSFSGKTIGASRPVFAGSTPLCSTILLILAFLNSLVFRPARQYAEQTRCVISCRSSIRCFATFIRPR